VTLPAPDVPTAALPKDLTRTDLPLPEIAEIDVVRHFVRLSQLNHAVDTGFYPLGSCTMKYNPKINEDLARLPGFAYTHPLQDRETVQGNLALMYMLQEWLKEIAASPGSACNLRRRAWRTDRHPDPARLSQVARRSQAHQDPDPQFGARH